MGRGALPDAPQDDRGRRQPRSQDGHHRGPARQEGPQLPDARGGRAQASVRPHAHRRGLRRLVLARLVRVPGRGVERGARLVGGKVFARQLPRFHARSARVERHERALRVQRPGDYHAQGPHARRRHGGAQGGAQRVRYVLPRGDGAGFAYAEKRRGNRTSSRPLACFFRRVAARRPGLDRGQRRGLGPLKSQHSHDTHVGRRRPHLVRRRRRRLLRRPRPRARHAVVPARCVLPFFPGSRALGHETARALDVRRAVHRFHTKRHPTTVRAHAVSVHFVRGGAPHGRARVKSDVV
mmetsp:Transcript_251/g.1042  ORF Transcript_251/g.1042 Transcript_251/m.1042 type:complete len:295 (-) Transcript_251:970-1854(-)